MRVGSHRGTRGGSGLFNPLTMAVWAIALMMLFVGYPFLKTAFIPSTEKFSPSPSPAYTPANPAWALSGDDWVVISGTQYNIWDYRQQVGPIQVLRAQVVTQQGSSAVIGVTSLRAQVLTLGLEVTSAELVASTYGHLQQAAVVSTALGEVGSLRATNLPPDVASSLESLQSSLAAGGDAAAPVVNAIALGGSSAKALVSTHTEAAAESYLDAMTAGSVPEGRVVAVFFVLEAAGQLGIPISGWASQLQADINAGLPLFTSIQDTYGQAAAVGIPGGS